MQSNNKAYQFKNTAFLKPYTLIIVATGIILSAVLTVLNPKLSFIFFILSIIIGFAIANGYCLLIYPHMNVQKYIWYQNLKKVTHHITFRKYFIYDMTTNGTNVCVLANIYDDTNDNDFQKLQPYLEKIKACANQTPGQYTTIQVFAGQGYTTDPNTDTPVYNEPI